MDENRLTWFLEDLKLLGEAHTVVKRAIPCSESYCNLEREIRFIGGSRMGTNVWRASQRPRSLLGAKIHSVFALVCSSSGSEDSHATGFRIYITRGRKSDLPFSPFSDLPILSLRPRPNLPQLSPLIPLLYFHLHFSLNLSPSSPTSNLCPETLPPSPFHISLGYLERINSQQYSGDGYCGVEVKCWRRHWPLK